jgi:hypothetical protein
MTDPTLKIINEYIQLLITEYEFDENELRQLWVDHRKTMPQTEYIEEKQSSGLDLATLKKYKKTELQELCKEKGLKTTGVKSDLIDRILGKSPPSNKPTTSKNSSKKKGSKKMIADILQKIMHNSNVINIRRNISGNFEHIETGFIFDEATNKVTGKQNDDGTISKLTEKDIELCKEYNFKYEIPETIEIEKPYDDEIMYEEE